jgi:hypothetical protein
MHGCTDSIDSGKLWGDGMLPISHPAAGPVNKTRLPIAQSFGRRRVLLFLNGCEIMDIVLYLLFLAVGFGLGIVCSISVFANRIERLNQRAVAVPAPQVQVNVSAELVARYLDSFDLIAIPKHLVSTSETPVTKH